MNANILSIVPNELRPIMVEYGFQLIDLIDSVGLNDDGIKQLEKDMIAYVTGNINMFNRTLERIPAAVKALIDEMREKYGDEITNACLKFLKDWREDANDEFFPNLVNGGETPRAGGGRGRKSKQTRKTKRRGRKSLRRRR